MVVWRPALDHRGKGQLHTGLLHVLLKMPDSFQVFCLPTVAGYKRCNVLLSWLDHSVFKNGLFWLWCVLFSLSVVITLKSCSMSSPQHYLIRSVSQLTAYQHWRQKDWSCSGEWAVDGKEGSRSYQSSHKHHDSMIYFWDGEHAQFTPVKMPELITYGISFSRGKSDSY